MACGGSTTPEPRGVEAERATGVSPLGPSYVLVPLPGEDPGLLGRVLARVPQPGRSLDEVSQPNPCAEHLSPAVATPSVNTFEDAAQLSIGASASATLGMFGFRADADRATHIVYRLSTERQIQQRDTAAYVTCCASRQCGYGYVAALVYGSGEYASAEEVIGSGRIDVAFAAGEGSIDLRVLHRRAVRGYLAAVVRVTTKDDATTELGALGVPDKDVNLSTTSAQYRRMYDKEKIWVCADPVQRSWAFCDIRGQITENEFVRRHRETTGSDELADVESDRVGIPASALLTLGSAALAGGGLALWLTDPERADSDPSVRMLSGVGMFAVGATAVIAFGTLWLFESASSPGYDGHPTDHSLTESDGRRYADRYNRALLRRVLRDAQRGQQSSAIPPFSSFRTLF
jgi:hypothetical protein